MMRAMMSEAPPGGYVVISRTCFAGAVCADAGEAKQGNTNDETQHANAVSLVFMSPSCSMRIGHHSAARSATVRMPFSYYSGRID
jgi:hypothetical protein